MAYFSFKRTTVHSGFCKVKWLKVIFRVQQGINQNAKQSEQLTRLLRDGNRDWLRHPAKTCSFFHWLMNLLSWLCHSDFDTTPTLTPQPSGRLQNRWIFLTDVSHLKRLRGVGASPVSLNSRGNTLAESRALTPAELEVVSLGACRWESAGPQCDTYKVSVRQRQQHGDSLCIMKQGFQKASRFLTFPWNRKPFVAFKTLSRHWILFTAFTSW